MSLVTNIISYSLGEVSSLVAISKKEAFDVQNSILEGSEISLLGQAYLSRIGLVKITGDEMLLR